MALFLLSQISSFGIHIEPIQNSSDNLYLLGRARLRLYNPSSQTLHSDCAPANMRIAVPPLLGRSVVEMISTTILVRLMYFLCYHFETTQTNKWLRKRYSHSGLKKEVKKSDLVKSISGPIKPKVF
jgi:hypothetical protein